MKEIICINVGQAGIQISNAIWELMCIEHAISNNGHSTVLDPSGDTRSCDSIFLEVSENRFVPRCLSVDLEPTVIDEIRTGIYRELFNASQLISGLEDSASNYARGHFTVGKIYLEEFMNTLRHIINLCDSLQGFMVIQSFGGGCGSGFTSLIMEQISIEHNKKSKMQFSIVPSSNLTSSIVEPYNAVLSSKTCIETTDLCFQHDNQSIYNVAFDRLEIRNPTFNNVNRILAQVFSSLTISMRYENALNNDFDQIATNLIPFPRLHYPINIYSPICNVNSGTHFLCSVTEITKDVFSFQNRLLDCDFVGEKFLSCCLQYRGNVSPSEVNKAVMEIKKMESINFVDWCPTGYKIGINKYPAVTQKNSYLFNSERSLLLLSNNTCFHQKVGKLNSIFDHLFSKRSFIHWFVGEGMEEGEFSEAREDFAILQEDYKCVSVNEIIEKFDATNAKLNVENTNKDDINMPRINNEIYEYIEENSKQKTNSEEDGEVLSFFNNAKLVDEENISFEKLKNIEKKKSSKMSLTSDIKIVEVQSSGPFIEESQNEKERDERLKEFLKDDESTQSDISTL